MTLRLVPGKGVRQSPSLASLSTRVSSTDSLCTLGGESEAEPRQACGRISAPRKALKCARFADDRDSGGRLSLYQPVHSRLLTLPVNLKRIPLSLKQQASTDWPGQPDQEEPWFLALMGSLCMLELLVVGAVAWALFRQRLTDLSSKWSVMRKAIHYMRRFQILARRAKKNAGPVLALSCIAVVMQLRDSHLRTLVQMWGVVGSRRSISSKPATSPTRVTTTRLDMPDHVPIDSYTLIPEDIYASLMAAARRGAKGQHMLVGNRLRLAIV